VAFQFLAETVDEVDSVPTAHSVPAGEAWMALMMPSVDPI